MLIVAVHDVAPSELGDVRWLLEQLDALGVRRRVLKVVPAEGGRAANGELVELIRREADAGSEIVVHGWTHRTAGRLRGSLSDRARGRLFAPEAAEFLSLTDTEAAARVDAGREWLARHDLPAVGFCPPGWLAASGLRAILRHAGFAYLVTLRGLLDLATGRWTLLPPSGYVGAGRVQEALVRVGSSLIGRPLGRLLGSPAHRVFLHPQSARSSRDCRRVLARIAELAERHQATTYRELLDA